MYSRGETIRIEVEVYDSSTEQLTDPDTMEWRLITPSEEEVASGGFSPIGTGRYQANVTIPESGDTGIWKVKIIAEKGGLKSIEYLDLRVST